MAGHSKWNNIKRKKGAADQRRGRLFTKLSKEIMVAARLGGGDPAGNPRLRLAIDAARGQSMPMDNIVRAVKKGTGELEGGQLEEVVYEGYGPGGVAFILEAATDNTTRTLNEVRNIFDKTGGSFAKVGAVAFLFQRLGMIRVPQERYSEEEVAEAAIEAGAEDIRVEDDAVVVYTQVSDFHAVQTALDKAGIQPEITEFTMEPSTLVACDEEMAKRNLKLLEKLEDNDDVQNVWTNMDIPDDVLGRLEPA
ncbi:MAG: YebC/PmpR family DNA-binding transcriptional regulator [Myxococcota bacterium]